MKRIIDKTVISKDQPRTTNVLWFQPETKVLHIHSNGEWIPIGSINTSNTSNEVSKETDNNKSNILKFWLVAKYNTSTQSLDINLALLGFDFASFKDAIYNVDIANAVYTNNNLQTWNIMEFITKNNLNLNFLTKFLFYGLEMTGVFTYELDDNTNDFADTCTLQIMNENEQVVYYSDEVIETDNATVCISELTGGDVLLEPVYNQKGIVFKIKLYLTT